jgi:hypothetical protein
MQSSHQLPEWHTQVASRDGEAQNNQEFDNAANKDLPIPFLEMLRAKRKVRLPCFQM